MPGGKGWGARGLPEVSEGCVLAEGGGQMERPRRGRRIDAFKLWCWRTLESPLDCKIKPVILKGNQILNIHWKDGC